MKDLEIGFITPQLANNIVCRVEAIEVQAIKLRESMVNQNENLRRMSMLGGSKAKLLRKVNREFTKR